MGFDWNGNGREDAGDWYIDYEIMNHQMESDSSESYPRVKASSNKGSKKKETKPLTAEELERNGRFLRRFFIVIGLLFAIPTLISNIQWLFFLPQFASIPGIIISIVALVIIFKNIWKHHKARKAERRNKNI